SSGNRSGLFSTSYAPSSGRFSAGRRFASTGDNWHTALSRLSPAPLAAPRNEQAGCQIVNSATERVGCAPPPRERAVFGHAGDAAGVGAMPTPAACSAASRWRIAPFVPLALAAAPVGPPPLPRLCAPIPLTNYSH